MMFWGCTSKRCCSFYEPVTEEMYLAKLSNVGRIWGYNEGGDRQYCLNQLVGRKYRGIGYSGSLSYLTEAMKKLSPQERFELGLLVLAYYTNLDGEYSEAVSHMIMPYKKDMASRIRKLDKKKLKKFVDSMNGDYKDFKHKCVKYFAFDL